MIFNMMPSMISGGGADWQTLADETTTSEGLVQILVSGVSVKEILVFAYVPIYANDFVLYVPLMQTSATHYDRSGYERMMITVSKSTSAPRLAWLKTFPLPIDGVGAFFSSSIYGSSESNVRYKWEDGKTNMTANMTITSFAVATYQNTPAGTRIVALGR